MSAVTEAAATELSTWADELSDAELAALRDPRNWVRRWPRWPPAASPARRSCCSSCAAGAAPAAFAASPARSARGWSN